MGKIEKVFFEKIIDPEPDHNANLVRIYKAPNHEATLHFRNLKIVLHSPEEIAEWKHGFAEALKKLNDKKLLGP